MSNLPMDTSSGGFFAMIPVSPNPNCPCPSDWPSSQDATPTFSAGCGDHAVPQKRPASRRSEQAKPRRTV